jgi:hypothetical protein
VGLSKEGRWFTGVSPQVKKQEEREREEGRWFTGVTV